jgi:ribosome-associated protein
VPRRRSLTEATHLTIIATNEDVAGHVRAADVPAPTPLPDAETLARAVLLSLEDSKAEDIVSLDVKEKSSIADMMIVASGRSNRHVGAIADRLFQDLAAQGVQPLRVSGMPHCDWVLIDLGDVLVHVFRPEVRGFYNLEKMWSAEPPAPRPAPKA